MAPVSKQKRQYKYTINAESIRKAIKKLFFPRRVRAGCMRNLMVMLQSMGKILIRHKTVHQHQDLLPVKSTSCIQIEKKATAKLKNRKK